MTTATTSRKWTIADIDRANIGAGHYFFSPDTLRFFGDRKSFWTVRHVAGRVFLVRKHEPSKPPRGTCPVGQAREFNPATGHIGVPISQDEATAAGL